MTKDAVRRSVLDIRRGTGAFLKEKSLLICGKFYKKFSAYDSFLMYSPIKGEVDVLPAAEKLFRDGKKVYFPSVEGDNICFRMFEGFENMEPGCFGIPEPKGERLAGKFDVIAVPAVAFDVSCHRLGYGRGFYDRFLASCGPCFRAGLAYGFQVVDTVYPEAHDEPVDIIITEERIIRRKG